MKDKTEWNLLEEQFRDLLNMEKAHLPSLPAPPERCEPQPPKLMREEVVRDLESQVRQLIEEHVFEREIKLKDVKETMAEKIEEVARALKASPYETAQAKWLVYKQHTLKQADETSIYRWDNDVSKIYKLSPPNAGKAITDNNPYVNFIDIEEFDVNSEIFPYYDIPQTWDPELMMTYFMPMHAEVTGDPKAFLAQIKMDKQRMMEEAMGQREAPVAGEKETDLAKLKEEIRAYAKSLGFPAMGVTKLDRRYIAENADDQLSYDTLILLPHEMPLEDFRKIPP